MDNSLYKNKNLITKILNDLFHPKAEEQWRIELGNKYYYDTEFRPRKMKATRTEITRIAQN